MLIAAARLKTEELENVLYVADAGLLLADAMGDGEHMQLPTQAILVEYLLKLAKDQNPDVLPEEEGNPTMRDFIRMLNDNFFVIFLDEQGHAYMELEGRGDHHTFGMLQPNFYINGGQRLRVVLTGSNQGSFETSLNGEYVKCLNYVQPMANEEAATFNNLFSLNLTEEDMCF